MKKYLWKILFVIWIVISLYICVIAKLSFSVMFFDIESITYYINLCPFRFVFDLIQRLSSVWEYEAYILIQEVLFGIKNFLLNMLLFILGGFCLYKINKQQTKTVLYIVVIQAIYEMCQLILRLFNIGTCVFDIDDIIAAAAGAFLGILISELVKFLKKAVYL